MRIFITGGCKNGKSYHARRLAMEQAGENSLCYYAATMKSTGIEDDECIARHRLEREGCGFVTIEQHTRIEELLLQKCAGGSILLDSTTALLANEMFHDSGTVDETAARRVTEGLLRLIGCIENLVIVSDYIYSDAIAYDPISELYRKSLAEIDRAAAENCDTVCEIAYSGVIVHKSEGSFLLDNQENRGTGMTLIFGGAYQGKLQYALERFCAVESDVYRCSAENTEMPKGRIIYELDRWIFAVVREGADCEGAVSRFAEQNADAVVICNDISCGVVPNDPVQRSWREAVGRAMAVLSGHSGEVVRVFCGIPTRIK